MDTVNEEAQEWSKTNLGTILVYDFWNAESAIHYLSAVICEQKLVRRSDICENLTEILKSQYNDDVWEIGKPPAYFIEWALSKRFRPDWLDWAIERDLYSPKQEAAQPAQNATAPDYSTAWLTIQQATINEFFNPRRNPDAKKEEVVGWIKSAAVEAGLPNSHNIASTIFTIIKPENHDPKKKRVKPQ